jgi:kynurenine formamidase
VVARNTEGIHLDVPFHTGRDSVFGRPEFLSKFPTLTLDAARWIASRGISLRGADTPTPSANWIERHYILPGKGVELIVRQRPEARAYRAARTCCSTQG